MLGIFRRRAKVWFVTHLAELREEILFGSRKLLRDLDAHFDEDVASRIAAQRSDAEVAEPNDVTGLSSGLDLDLALAVEGRESGLRAKGRGNHGNCEAREQIVAFAMEDLVFLDAHLDEEVTCGAASLTRFALTAKLDAAPGIDTRGNAQRNRALFLHTAVPGTRCKDSR